MNHTRKRFGRIHSQLYSHEYINQLDHWSVKYFMHHAIMNDTNSDSFEMMIWFIKYSMFLCPVGHKHSHVYSLEYINQLNHWQVKYLMHHAIMNHTNNDLFVMICPIKYSMFLCPEGHKHSQLYSLEYINQLDHWSVKYFMHHTIMNDTNSDSFEMMIWFIKYSMFLCPAGRKHSQVYSLEYINQLQHCFVTMLIQLVLEHKKPLYHS